MKDIGYFFLNRDSGNKAIAGAYNFELPVIVILIEGLSAFLTIVFAQKIRVFCFRFIINGIIKLDFVTGFVRPSHFGGLSMMKLFSKILNSHTLLLHLAGIF